MAALVILLFIWHNLVHSRRLQDQNGRIFSVFMALGILDVLFDIMTTTLISDGVPDLSGMTMVLLTIFYLLQVIVPYSLFLYTWSLCGQTGQGERAVFGLLSVPAAVMGLIVLVNVKSGMLFSIDGAGEYIKGPFYLGMYRYAIVYGGIVLGICLWKYRKLGNAKAVVILEFLLILGVCVGIQAAHNELLMTGFGLSLGILVLYLTINNPSGHTDQLTGLLNNLSFREQVQELLRHKKSFHIITAELSQLKRINMVFGIGQGDALLRQIADELDSIWEDKRAFRLSGKRFALVAVSHADYERAKKRITEFLKRDMEIAGERLQISSIVCGIEDADELEDYESILSYIDYMASMAPPAMEMTYMQSDERTRKGFLERKEIEQYLRTAVAEDLFEVYFQPVYSLKTGDFVTLEALSRLRHPKLGFIPPDVFIRIAEANGQIADIGALQFRRVCRFVKDHPELIARLKNVKFNLSSAEVVREGCGRRFIETIREFKLPCDFFQFEITETVATECGQRMDKVVKEFTACGIRLSMDDFGSGYANLDSVLKLAFSSIKLDRSLLSGIIEDEKARMFYKNIVAVLQNMGYSVISEGVESEKEVELLRSWGVDMIQGYYFSRPLPQEELLDLLFP